MLGAVGRRSRFSVNASGHGKDDRPRHKLTALRGRSSTSHRIGRFTFGPLSGPRARLGLQSHGGDLETVESGHSSHPLRAEEHLGWRPERGVKAQLKLSDHAGSAARNAHLRGRTQGDARDLGEGFAEKDARHHGVTRKVTSEKVFLPAHRPQRHGPPLRGLADAGDEQEGRAMGKGIQSRERD
jgi:hypothetical protein